MDQISQLVEQHIRASESHLQHIDELMQRAATAQAARAVLPEDAAWLAKFQLDRTRLGQELDDIQGQSAHDAHAAAKRGEGVAGALQTMGAELEKALLAIFERDNSSGSF